jgi:hypothetical protein
VRALRCDVLNVPKPTNVIDSPFFNALVTPEKNESTAADALLLLSSASFAIYAMSSCLFMQPPEAARAARRIVD